MVASLDGSGSKKVFLDIPMTYTSQVWFAKMKVHVKGYNKVCIIKEEGLER